MGVSGYLDIDEGAPKRPSAARRFLATTAAAALGLVTLTAIEPPARAQTGDGTVTVRVVRAVTADGVYNPVLEPGMSGVEVDLTDNAGGKISGITAADGTVTLSPAASALTGGQYRVQVVDPKPGVLFPAFASAQGLAGAPTQLSSNEEFVDLSGGKNVSYTTGLWNPDDYCQKNAPLATGCIPSAADPTTKTTVLTFPYEARGVTAELSNQATAADTGGVYGIGWSKQKQWIFSSATAHRYAPYGPGGAGGIYLTPVTINQATSATTSNGPTTLFATVPNVGGTAHEMSTDKDAGFMPAVGKESLGDLYVSPDGKDLYVVNLADKQLYRYDATTASPGAPRVYPIPAPVPNCPQAVDWRPYGLGMQDGVLYVGGVCSGESSGSVSDMRAIVQTFDPVAGAFTGTVLDQPLNYPRPASAVGFPCPGAGWYPWSDTVRTTQQNYAAPGSPYTCVPDLTGYPQPELASIVIDTNGNMLMGFRDRFGDQVGLNDPQAVGNDLPWSSATGGDLNLACPVGGRFVMDVNGGCGKSGTGNKVFDVARAGYHNNAANGGTALSKVETTIASTMLDPLDIVYTGGIGFTNRSTDPTSPGQPDPGLGNELSASFGKGGSMASLQVLCDQAPLQIGNRLWYDVDKDGVQDPQGEKPVVGATVHLYDSTGALVATKKTTARGEYYFDSVNDGLKPDTQYTIKVDNPADYASGGPLYQWVPTVPDAGGNSFVDSKGVVPPGGTYPQTVLTTGGPGQDNHTYDFGFYQPTGVVKVLKTDQNNAPLPGATFQLWQDTNGTAGLQTASPNADTPVGTPCTTDANGACTSGQLPLGTYYWQETAAPNGYVMPSTTVLGPSTLTTTNFATVQTVTAANQQALGVVKVVKTDQNGKPLPGAVFQLWQDTNGTAGLQATGPNADTAIGTSCTTDATGTCASAPVPIGTYYWQETATPTGYVMPSPAVFGPVTLTMANYTAGVSVPATNQQALGVVRVLKTDQNGNPLANAVFQLWQETNGTAGLQTTSPNADTAIGSTCTTDATGTCASAPVPIGTYYWQETAAPNGYVMPAQPVAGPLVLTMANFTAGVSATATNQQALGVVKVVKNDQNGKPLSGAVFQLWQDTNGTAGLQATGPSADTAIGTSCTTDATGTCASAPVPIGTYFWQETAAPNGYLMPAQPVAGPLVLTMANYTAGVSTTATNQQALGVVKVLKTDQSGKALPGAVFQLWQDTNGTSGLQTTGPSADTAVGTSCTTDATGTCASAPVPIGTYFWQETAAPNGYVMPAQPVVGPLVLTMANFTAGVSATAANQQALGVVKVVKNDQNGMPLPGAVFQLWQDTNTTAGLQTAGPNADTAVGTPCTTDATGTCASAPVPIGTYFWQETAAPSGYIMPSPAVFGPLVLTMANYTAGVSVTAANQQALGVVRLLKLDQNNAPLAGAVFQLWQDTNGTTGLQTTGPNADTTVGTPCTTDATGACASAPVPIGTYFWQETSAPNGYLMPSPAVFGPLVLTMANYTAGVSASATNQQALGVVKVVKTDPGGNPLPDAVFQLWRETNGTAGLQTAGPTADTAIGSSCTTDATGTCASAPLPIGTYYWQETTAPPGYVLPSPAVSGPLVLTMANYSAGLSTTAVDQQDEGIVRILKTGQNGAPLPGATFQLWQETNSTPGLQTTGPNADTLVGTSCVTNAIGVCVSKLEDLGTYYWQETAAPNGYVLPSPAVFGPLELTSGNYTAGVSATAANQQALGVVKVLKTDPSGNPLAGAVFQLWQDTNGTAGLQSTGPNADTTVGTPCTTDATGTCASVPVPIGTYFWLETAAPSGYLMPAQPVVGPLVLTMANFASGVSASQINVKPAPPVPPAPPAPAGGIDIEKYDVAGGMPDPYDPSVIQRQPGVDADTAATAVVYKPGTPRIVYMAIKNTGAEPLKDVTVGDRRTGGVGDVKNVSCDFSKLGGPSTGTTWSGPFLPGSWFFCKGLLTLPPNSTHQDTASVQGTGTLTGRKYADQDDFHARTPRDLPRTGADDVVWLGELGGTAVVGGAGVLTATAWHRRRRRPTE